MTLHLTVPANQTGRDFVVGDLHGMHSELQQRLTQLKFSPVQGDRLFSVGDLIDRGPDSVKCLQLLNEPWFYAVQGNHERFLIDSIIHKLEAPYSTWIANGGVWSMDVDEDELIDWANSVAELPVTISIEQDDSLPIGIVHAEFPLAHWDDRLAYEDIESPAISAMLWSRTQIKSSVAKTVQGVEKIYLGHTPQTTIQQLGNSHFIDLGCYLSNDLAVIEI